MSNYSLWLIVSACIVSGLRQAVERARAKSWCSEVSECQLILGSKDAQQSRNQNIQRKQGRSNSCAKSQVAGIVLCCFTDRTQAITCLGLLVMCSAFVTVVQQLTAFSVAIVHLCLVKQCLCCCSVPVSKGQKQRQRRQKGSAKTPKFSRSVTQLPSRR